MAGTVLSPGELARIDRDLDELVMPSPETVRALVAGNRALRDQLDKLTARHLRLAGAASAAATVGELLVATLERDAQEALK